MPELTPIKLQWKLQSLKKLRILRCGHIELESDSSNTLAVNQETTEDNKSGEINLFKDEVEVITEHLLIHLGGFSTGVSPVFPHQYRI